MLFIQALEKVQAKPIKHIRSSKKITVARRKENTDTVDLSDSMNPISKINKNNITEPNPLIDIEAILLQQALLHLSGLPIPIYSIQALNLKSDEWQIELQKPPKTSPTRINQCVMGYSNTVKHGPTEIINYPFSMEIKSSNGKIYCFCMDIRVARFTQKSNQWPQENIDRINLLPTELIYDSNTLDTMETQFTFFFDQDGDENQAQSILESMKNAPTSTLLKNNDFFQGMRMWRNNKEQLDIALIGDPYIGAIHAATFNTPTSSH